MSCFSSDRIDSLSSRPSRPSTGLRLSIGLRRLSSSLLLLLLLTLVAAAPATADDEGEVRSFIHSVAETMYAVAWPTATYEGVTIHDFRTLSNGLDIEIRLYGESHFGGALWLDLLMEIRNGDLHNMEVKQHNALLVPPFETAKALGTFVEELAAEFSESTAPAAPAPSSIAPRASASSQRAAAVCVQNPTENSLSFYYRWGDDEWVSETLKPGYEAWFTYALPTAGSTSPRFYVEFDNSFNEGYTATSYWLERNSVTLPANCRTAKKYRFGVKGRSIVMTAGE